MSRGGRREHRRIGSHSMAPDVFDLAAAVGAWAEPVLQGDDIRADMAQ